MIIAKYSTHRLNRSVFHAAFGLAISVCILFCPSAKSQSQGDAANQLSAVGPPPPAFSPTLRGSAEVIDNSMPSAPNTVPLVRPTAFVPFAVGQQNPFMPAWLPAYARAVYAAMPNQASEAPLQGKVEKQVERPTWIPMAAYSDESMITEYHNLDTMWSDKRPIPPEPQFMNLSPSVVRFWNGYKEEPYWVKTVPDKEHPGSFVFLSTYQGGPKGWLQEVDKPGRWGFPQYRYWFDPR